MNKGRSRFARALLAFVITLSMTGSVLASGASPALAGNMGQQVGIGSYHKWSHFRVTGYNQYWQWASTGVRSGSPSYTGPRYYYWLSGWWWQGNVTVETWNTQARVYRSKTCSVPSNQWGDWYTCLYDW